MSLKRYITTTIFLCLFCVNYLQAQNHQADSLYNAIQISHSPKDKLSTILKFCGEYRSFPYDTLFTYSEQAIALSKQLNDNQSLAEGLYFKTIYFYRTSKIDSAYAYLDKINNIKEQQNNKFINRYNLLIATTYIKDNKIKKALDDLYNILSQTKQQGDTFQYLRTIGCIGWAYLELGNIKEAKKWLLQGIHFPPMSSYMKARLHIYANLVPCYGMEGNLDSTKYYLDKAQYLADEYDDLILKANTLNFRANVYQYKKDYKNAIKEMLEAIKVREYINDPFYIVSDMINLADVYASFKQADSGIAILNKAYEIIKKNNLTAKLPYLYGVLYTNYTVKGDYKKASDALLKLVAIKDTLYLQNSAKSLAEMEVKYRMSEKESLINKQKYALLKNKYWIYGTTIFSLLIILLAIAFYRAIRNKQKIKLHKLQLQQQDDLTKAIVQAEETERRRIAADLHDGLGQMLTAARYNISGIAHCVKDWNEEDKTIFNKSEALIDESCKEIRNISHNIMPNTLLIKGLSFSVNNLIQKINTKKLKVSFNAIAIDENVDIDIQVILYRIIQESINNVIKHAEATQLDISVMNNESGISMSIEDNGKGFNYNELNETNAMGLKSIKTRVQYLNGQLEIDSSPGRGALLSIFIPKSIDKNTITL